MTSPAFSYNAEMGYSHRELGKELPSAVEPYRIERNGDGGYTFSSEGRVARMRLMPERVRRIASLALPLTEVSIEFENFSEQQYSDFMKRFKQHLQRGGG